MQIKKIIQTYGKTCGVLFLINLLGICAILRANFSYIDDLGRVQLGTRGWVRESRFLSEGLSVLLHTNMRVSDISPLPQLLAAFLLAIAGTIVLYLFHGDQSRRIRFLPAVVTLGINPYFLECLSYKFDAPYMALSVLLSVLPFLFIKKKRNYLLFSVLSLLAMYTTYQASSGIYPMLALLLFFRRWNRKEDRREAARFLLQSVVSYILATGLFRLLMPLSTSWYPTAVLSLRTFLPDLAANYRILFQQMRADFNPIWKGAILLVLLAFLYRTQKESRQNRFLALLEASLLLVLLFACAYGIYIFLQKPFLAPRAMYGYCVCLTLLSVYGAESFGAEIPMAWCFLVFGLTYGNALQAQKTFTERRLAAAISAADQSHAFSSSVKGLQIAGTIGKAPTVMNMQTAYPIIVRLIPDTLTSGWVWSEFILQNEIGQNTYTLTTEQLDLSRLSQQDLPLVADNAFETIRANDAYILITFHAQ